MAEAKNKVESKGERRYNHGPRIQAKDSGLVTPDKEAMNEGGDAAPEGSAMAGTDGVPSDAVAPSMPGGEEGTGMNDAGAITARHMTEHKDMAKRHGGEMKDMHKRHMEEHKKMMERHGKESSGNED